MSWFSNIFRRKPCQHDTDYRSRTYVDENGTPMIDFECFKCGWKDHGHVYGDAEGWENLIIKRDGVEVFNQKGRS
jgi:hypothetical protein